MRNFQTSRDDQSPMGGSTYQGGPPVIWRDGLDAKRVADGLAPGTGYPDGYLGTITNRREDRLTRAVWRQNGRSYTRGVHKGERLDMSNYLWPEEFNLMSGLEQQMTGLKFVSPAIGDEVVILHNEGRPSPRDPLIGRPNTGVPTVVDPNRALQLQRLAPSWGY